MKSEFLWLYNNKLDVSDILQLNVQSVIGDILVIL